MKLFNPSPVVLEIGSDNITSYHSSLGMLAITPGNELKVVREIKQFPFWRHYWGQIRSGKLPHEVFWEENPIESSISSLGNEIIQGLRYTMSKGYVFVGFCYLDGNIFDNQYLAQGLFAKRKNKHFINMHQVYRQTEKYPEIIQNNAIEAAFIGQGEKFFALDRFSFQQICQMSDFFRGSFSGIAGINLEENIFQFIILSQNITSDANLGPMTFDKKGLDTTRTLINNEHFSPAGGFKIDYGIWSLENLPFWSSLDLFPQFTKDIQVYFDYLKALIKRQEPQYLKNPRVSALDKIIQIKEEFPKEIIQPPPVKMGIPEPQKLTTPLPEVELVKSSEEKHTQAVNKPQVKELELKKPELQPVNLSKPSLPKVDLAKPALPKTSASLPQVGVENFDLTTAEASISELDGYDDVFQQEPEELFNADGQAIVDPSNMDEKFMYTASSTLEKDFGLAIDLNLMSEEDVFKDLEASLAAMSKLDELASKNSAISRIYYPPPTLIAFANKEKMKIGGSTTILSMGAGRNIWMVPELKRMEMWGKFYKEQELSDQIEDFIALPEKDIESKDELDSLVQKAFINIRKNNQIFLGVGEIEGNGFERNVFEECKLDDGNLTKIMNIFSERRQTLEFPELNPDSYIEVRYFGNPKAISFFAKSDSLGILEIANDYYNTTISKKGVLTGIVCTDFEAVYFFILTNNLDELEQESPNYLIDSAILDRMYDMIEHDKLTPVSWFKVMCGFHGLEMLPQWEEINDEAIFPIIQDQYSFYMNKLLKMKTDEDEIRKKAEAGFPKKDE